MYRLLIVDDEPLIRRGIASLAALSRIGITEVAEAQNGEEAVEKSDSFLPHIVLMDINMPQMDGLTASEKIKEKHPEIFVVILTGYDYFEYAQAAIRAKVDDYILKPVSKSDIEMTLKRIVGLLGERAKEAEKLRLLKMQQQEEKEEIPEQNLRISEYLKRKIFSSDLSLSSMAADIGFNSSYLSGLIKQLYGIPFQDYVHRKRMEKAKLLLLSTSMKNYEVAEAVGIEDVNYFVTKFKKTFGRTPKQYRQEAGS
ncbi:MAG: response regulator [Peptostreptococcaceae bacterium]|nr:response regulator [Peptostreptococcaceae bacterium]